MSSVKLKERGSSFRLGLVRGFHLCASTFLAAVEGHLDDILIAEHENPDLPQPPQPLRRLRLDEEQGVLGRGHQHRHVGAAPGLEPGAQTEQS